MCWMYDQQVLKYPISNSARKVIGELDIRELVTDQTVAEVKRRVDALLENRRSVVRLDDQSVWTFFGMVLLLSRFSKLAYKFASEESERMKDYFSRDRAGRIFTFADCCGEQLKLETRVAAGQQFVSIPVERYLALVEKHNLHKTVEFKLVNQDLDKGQVYIAYDALVDLFGECIKQKILKNINSFRRLPVPAKLQEQETRIIEARPQEEKDQEKEESRRYAYVEELLNSPVPDGRHRLLWLVLAPYVMTIKKMDEQQAIELLVEYAKKSGDKKDLRRAVIDNVKRAKRIGLKPPTLNTLRRKHPDVYALLPPEVRQKRTR
jgi:hypothetical protein